MRVENVQTTTAQESEKGFLHLCTFTLELSPHVKLYGLRLFKAPDGKLILHAAQTESGSNAYSMSPSLRKEIAELAVEAWKEAAMRKFARIARL